MTVEAGKLVVFVTVLAPVVAHDADRERVTVVEIVVALQLPPAESVVVLPARDVVEMMVLGKTTVLVVTFPARVTVLTDDE